MNAGIIVPVTNDDTVVIAVVIAPLIILAKLVNAGIIDECKVILKDIIEG